MADYLPWILMAVNGLIAGGLTGFLLGGGGLIRNVFVGMIGAFAGGALVQAGFLEIPFLAGSPWAHQIVVSTIGAVLVVVLARFISR